MSKNNRGDWGRNHSSSPVGPHGKTSGCSIGVGVFLLVCVAMWAGLIAIGSYLVGVFG